MKALLEKIDRDQRLQTVWGETDCWMWTGSWVEDQTGRHPFIEWRGLYDDEQGGRILLEAEANDAGGLVEAMDQALQLERLGRWQEVKTGDIAIVRQPLRQTIVLGVVYRADVWAKIEGMGIRPVERINGIIAAWRVPWAQ